MPRPKAQKHKESDNPRTPSTRGALTHRATGALSSLIAAASKRKDNLVDVADSDTDETMNNPSTSTFVSQDPSEPSHTEDAGASILNLAKDTPTFLATGSTLSTINYQMAGKTLSIVYDPRAYYSGHEITGLINSLVDYFTQFAVKLDILQNKDPNALVLRPSVEHLIPVFPPVVGVPDEDQNMESEESSPENAERHSRRRRDPVCPREDPGLKEFLQYGIKLVPVRMGKTVIVTSKTKGYSESELRLFIQTKGEQPDAVTLIKGFMEHKGTLKNVARLYVLKPNQA